MSKITKFIPLFDRILVEKAVPAKKTVGGVILPESAIEKVNHARVVEVGPGRMTEDGKRIPLTVKKGDLVMLTNWGGNSVKVNDKDMLVVREEEILGLVEASEK